MFILLYNVLSWNYFSLEAKYNCSMWSSVCFMMFILILFTRIINFFRLREWDYLSFRWWIGMWIAGILLIFVAVDASFLVCYITRFTEENFATLIAFIFIYKVSIQDAAFTALITVCIVSKERCPLHWFQLRRL